MHEHAVTPSALAADGTWFSVDHRRDAREPAAVVRFIAGHTGIFTKIGLPKTELSARILEAGKWRGFSVSYDRTEAITRLEAATDRVWVTYLDWFSGVALCIDTQPAWAETWAMVYGSDALARMKSEEHAYLSSVFGSDYKTSCPRSWWAPKEQAPNIETLLRARDPERGAVESLGSFYV